MFLCKHHQLFWVLSLAFRLSAEEQSVSLNEPCMGWPEAPEVISHQLESSDNGYSLTVRVKNPSHELISACVKAFDLHQWQDANQNCQAAAEAGSIRSRVYLGGTIYIQTMVTKQLPEDQLVNAYQHLSAAFDKGEALAGLWLGQMYLDGHLVTKNIQSALFYFEASAKIGELSSALKAGNIYFKQGTPSGYKNAVKYFQQAADGEKGLPEAAYILSRIYLKGIGVEADKQAAREWLEKAARKKDPEACLQMAALSIDQEQPRDPFNTVALDYLACSDQNAYQTQAYYCRLYWCTPKGFYHCEQLEKLAPSKEIYNSIMREDYRKCPDIDMSWEEWVSIHQLEQ